MRVYQELIKNVLRHGIIESQRALVNGEEVTTKVLYSERLEFNLQRGIFPLVGVKRTSFKIVEEELRWFIRGENNVTSLQKAGVKIWDDWADEDGNLGGSYPGCWRHFGGKADQIGRLERLFRLHRKMGPDDPTIRKNKRTLLLLGYDPAISDNRGPIGCHTLAQWHIDTRGFLHCDMYMRSVDLFLGLPYNIACYALLTNLWARIANLSAGMLVITMGNAHIYNNHELGCEELISREPRAKPVLVTNFEDPNPDDWSLLEGKWNASVQGYSPHPSIKGEIAV